MHVTRFGSALATALLTAALAGAAAADEAAVRKSMANLLGDAQPDSVQPSPVPGLFEVVVGARLYYMSEDGRYLFQGNVIDTTTRENITEAKQAAAKKVVMDKVSEDSMVVFAPEKYKHTITVFTDIDCGYCRKLHKEIADFNAEGIRVRYLFYPRAGVDSPSYQKAVSVWCADDRNQAMTDAKAGRPVETRTCDNPVREHMQLGGLMGVSGTPAIVMEDGQMLPGYIPAKRMAMFLNADTPAQ
jgi:thiol:disulfide interchange protein DsbC